MASKVQFRRDTAANWTSTNPILSAGEVGFETNTGKIKVGDGTNTWSKIATSCVESIIELNTAYTLTSQTAAQKLFNASTNGAITLPVGTYQFECFFSLSSMSASSGSFGFALGGTATFTQQWWSLAQKPTSVTASVNSFSTFNTAANTNIATANTNTVGYAFIKGILNVTVAGTVIPQVSLGVAAAAVVGVGSNFKVVPLSASNSTTNITLGAWS